jgi:hypothetical protein
MDVSEVDSYVRDAIVDEIIECTCKDMRHENGENTDDAGRVSVGGEIWLYRR